MVLYDQIGSTYDTTRRADPFIYKKLFELAKIATGNYLDLACGSGNYTIALQAMAGSWHGVDQSQIMIDAAKQKSQDVTWNVANADKLSYDNDSFDGAICTLAIHHFPDLKNAFTEVSRVLNNGRFVIFTSTPAQMKRYWLMRYFPKAMRESMKQMPSLEKVENALKEAQLKLLDIIPYSVQRDLQDFFLYSGKYRPEIYLNEKIRSGISTFTCLADSEEIKNGCAFLKRDIERGKIHEVIQSAIDKNDEGDYCFIVAQ